MLLKVFKTFHLKIFCLMTETHRLDITEDVFPGCQDDQFDANFQILGLPKSILILSVTLSLFPLSNRTWES